jgi:glycogen debranching enzyme
LINITRTKATKRWLPDAGAVIERSAQRWNAWFSVAPPVPERYQAQYYFAWWVMAINLIYPYFHPAREGMVPARVGYFGIWLWDAYFHALAYRHVDTELAKNQIRIMLDHQLANGMIPDVVHDDGIVDYSIAVVEAPVTKPPLLAWAALKVYEIDRDRAFLDEIFDPLMRVQSWWIEECDADDNGLFEYHHPYSSGLDDSPLWKQGLPLESPDLNAYLCLQYDLMAQIAESSTWRTMQRNGDKLLSNWRSG